MSSGDQRQVAVERGQVEHRAAVDAGLADLDDPAELGRRPQVRREHLAGGGAEHDVGAAAPGQRPDLARRSPATGSRAPRRRPRPRRTPGAPACPRWRSPGPRAAWPPGCRPARRRRPRRAPAPSPPAAPGPASTSAWCAVRNTTSDPERQPSTRSRARGGASPSVRTSTVWKRRAQVAVAEHHPVADGEARRPAARPGRPCPGPPCPARCRRRCRPAGPSSSTPMTLSASL